MADNALDENSRATKRRAGQRRKNPAGLEIVYGPGVRWKQNMKIQYQLRGLNARAVAVRPLDQHLERLDRLKRGLRHSFTFLVRAKPESRPES